MITLRGHTVAVRRAQMQRQDGWLWEVISDGGRHAASGWTVGYGPKAKSVAMRDALEALARIAKKAAN